MDYSKNTPLILQDENANVFDYLHFGLRFFIEFDTGHLFVKPNHIGGGQGNAPQDPNNPDSQVKFGNMSIIMNEIKKGIGAGKDYVVGLVMVVVNFFLYASIYPAVPFFGVLSFCYATMNWFFMKFRTL